MDCLVKRLRQKFLDVCQTSDQLFDPTDIDRVIRDDFTVKRFLWHNSMEESPSLRMLIESMKWRKTFGVNQMSDNHFSELFYRTGAVFPYCPDANGFPTLYVRLKMIKKVPELREQCKRFMVHHINQVDQKTSGKGWVLVVDAAQTGLANYDLELLVFLISTLNNHFPAALQYIVVHSVPLAMAGIWRIVRTFIPSERLDMIRFTDAKTIVELIPRHSLPDFMGGTATQDYRRVPPNAPNAIDFGVNTLGLSVEKVKKIVLSYEELIKANYSC